MGKGGEKGGESGEPEAQIRFYTWEEIQKHNLRTDKWLVIERKVYNVTTWANRHPGGQRVISHCAGEDATVRTDTQTHTHAVITNLWQVLVVPEKRASFWAASPHLSLTPAAHPAPFRCFLEEKGLIQIWCSSLVINSIEPWQFAASGRWVGGDCSA